MILRIPAYLGVGLVYAYRYTLGVLFPGGCKYHPSCSQYAIDALRRVRARARDRPRGLAPVALQPVEQGRGRLRRAAEALPMIIAHILEPLEDILMCDPRLARPARHDRADLGVVDRRADRDRAAVDGAARRQADPLDAGDAGAHAGDEGDPAALQERQAEAERRADEVLPGQQRQPGRALPPAPLPVPRLHRALSRPARSRRPHARGRPALVARYIVPDITEHANAHWSGLRAARDLRRQPARVDLLHVDDDGQDAADADDDPARRVRARARQLPGRARDLLGDDEPVDRRAGSRHAPAGAEEASGASETLVEDAAEEPGREWTAPRQRTTLRLNSRPHRLAPKRVRRKKKKKARR